MFKLGVIGDFESVMGFSSLGLSTFPAADAAEAKTILHRLALENYAVIYITEQLAVKLSSEIDRYKTRTTPAIILIPGRDGSLGIGKASVKSCVERAVGVDILSK